MADSTEDSKTQGSGQGVEGGIVYKYLQDDQPRFVPLIRQWLNACDSSHGSVCVAKPIVERPPEDVPLWLIDTHQQCIVPGLKADRYLALSYVWPETRGSSAPAPRTLLLDTASMVALQCPHSLSSEAVADSIPGVIRHAMGVTFALGERYLWVDRLCILQNDEKTPSQVAKMDQVYAGAYLTIIAAAPDRFYETGHVHEWPQFAPMYTFHSPLNEEEIVRIMSLRYGTLKESRWASRGWTYQEQILCKRAAIFSEEGVFWDCQLCMWDEVNLKPGQDFKDIPLRADMGKRFTTRWWPDFGFYVDLICPYNGRDFSYPEDALLGISGVLRALAPPFPGGFVCGIPRMFLDHALLWQPFGIAERRVDRSGSSSSDNRRAISSLPSWSFIGWQCFVDPWSLCSGLAYIDEHQSQMRAGSWATRNLVKWKVSGEEEKSDSMQWLEFFDHHSRLAITADTPLPEGWKRHDTPGTGSVKFSHKRDATVHFKHPIPLVPNPVEPPGLSIASELVFSTTTAIFTAASILRPFRDMDAVSFGIEKISVFEDEHFALGPSKEKSCPITVLQQPNGAFAGLLRMMNKDSIASVKSFELVAISTGSANARSFRLSHEWEVFERGKLDYMFRNRWHAVYYTSPPLTRKQKCAMVFTLTNAFSKEAAKSDAMAPKIKAEVDQLDSSVQSEVESKMESLNLGDEKRRMGYEANTWFSYRTKRLDELSWGADDILCEFYNVLWIERKDGVCYRRACGWVPKHVWEAYVEGPVEVRLR